MKKIIYITLFIILGIFINFIVHAIIEIIGISLLLYDFSKYGMGLTWQDWIRIHNIFAVFFLFVGVSLGGWQGFIWWKRIYGKK